MNAFVENLEHNFKLNFSSNRTATITAGGSLYNDPEFTINSQTSNAVTGLLNECLGAHSDPDSYLRDAFNYSIKYNDTEILERIAEHASKSGWEVTYVAEAFDIAYAERTFSNPQDARDFVSIRKCEHNETWHICTLVLVLEDKNGKRVFTLSGTTDDSGVMYSFSAFRPTTIAYVLDANGGSIDEFRKDMCLKVMGNLFSRAFHWIAYSNIK